MKLLPKIPSNIMRETQKESSLFSVFPKFETYTGSSFVIRQIQEKGSLKYKASQAISQTLVLQFA